MDHTPKPPYNGDASNDDLPVPDTAPDEVVPLPEDPPGDLMPLDDERVAPPVDIDERSDTPATGEQAAPIVLPGGSESGNDLSDQIDEHQPLPVTTEYHSDDTVAPDPYDVDDQVDLHLPRPTRDPESEVDDASTGEELDVDTAPGRRSNSFSSTGRIRFASTSTEDSSGERVYVGAPLEDAPVAEAPDHDPLNEESETFATASAATPSAPEEAVVPDDERDAGEPQPSPAPEHASSGETICPVCGRQTDALRFCGHCGTPLTDGRPRPTATTMVGRLQERGEHLLAPLSHWTRPGGVRFIMAAGGLLILLALLANNGALALMIGAAILPLILVFWCIHRDVFRREPLPLLAGLALAGILAGAILGWLGSLIVSATWFDAGILNYGAAGFGGAFAKAAGGPPFLVWALAGIVFPLLGLAAIVGVPLAMRQTTNLRDDVMGGLSLGAIMGGGISLGSAIVFASPLLTNGGPASDASTWTLTVIGLTIVRPLVWTLSGGLLGAATWRYVRTGSIGPSLVPAVIGAAGVLFFSFISLELGHRGLWYEILWGALIAIVVAFFYMRALDRAVALDRATLGNDDRQVVCPNCHRVTPVGQHCAHCGQELAAT